MALYALRKLFHSNELSPLQSLCRNLSRGSIIRLYWSLRRLTHLGSNLPGLQPTLHEHLPGARHLCEPALVRIDIPDIQFERDPRFQVTM